MNASLAGPAERPGKVEAFFIDLMTAVDLLEAAERDVPRLSRGDYARIESLARDPDRQRAWRALRIATRIILERFGGSAIRGRDFKTEEHGRPVLEAGAPYFNVSRSDGVALVAVSNDAPVGIDIERLRSLSMAEDRRRRILAASARFEDSSPSEPQTLDDNHVLKAWVRLEAVAKARGTGIGELLTAEGVVGGTHDGSALSCEFQIRRLGVPHGYVAAVAAKALPPELPVIAFPGNAEALARFLIPVPN